MSEELKPLPCYKCGGIATHSYYEKYPKGLEPLIMDGKIIREGKVWHFVNCEKCKEQRSSLHPKFSVEAIKEWNALPRALTWTTEPPKLAGHYWCRYKGEGSASWAVAYVPAVTEWEKYHMDENDRIEWAGPIPMPKEKAE